MSSTPSTEDGLLYVHFYDIVNACTRLLLVSVASISLVVSLRGSISVFGIPAISLKGRFGQLTA